MERIEIGIGIDFLFFDGDCDFDPDLDFFDQ
jgi:hypothetical protein